MPESSPRKELEKRILALEKELKFYQSSLDSFFVESPAGFCLFDLECRYIRINDTLARVAGLSPNEHLGRMPDDILPKQLADHIENYVREIIATGIPQLNQPFSCTFPDNPEYVRYWTASRFPLFDGYGKISGVGVVVVEITDLHQAQTELSRQETFNQTLLESIPARIFMKDCAGKYLYCNNLFAGDVGLSKPEIIGKSDLDLFRQDRAERYRQADLEVIDSGQPKEFDYQFEKLGREYYIQVKKAPVQEPDGKIQGIIGLFHDLTESKQAERQLCIADHALAGTLAGVAIGDPQGLLTYVNRTFTRMWGYEHDREILGRPAQEFWTEPEAALKIIDELQARGEWQGELTGLKKDGTTFIALLAASLIRDHNDSPICMIGSFIDVTARKEAEKRLRENEKKYRQIIDNIDDAVWIENSESGEVLYVSPAYEKIWGRSRETLYRNHEDWLNSLHPEDRTHAQKNHREFGAIKRNHYRVLHPEGIIRHVYTKTFPVLDEKGRVYREVGIAHDVTEAKLAEERIRNLSRRLLNVAEEERKSIARNLHDEFGQLMINFRRCQKSLLDLLPADSGLGAQVTCLDNLIERLDKMVQDTAYRLRPDILDNLGLLPALKWAIEDFANHCPGIKISFQVNGRPSELNPDHALVLYRIFQEGLTNIAKHSKAGNASIRLVFSYPSVILTIEDDGCGFDVDRKGRNSATAKGLGLRGINERIAAIDGKARISSQPGKGTTLRIEIADTPGQKTGNRAMP